MTSMSTKVESGTPTVGDQAKRTEAEFLNLQASKANAVFSKIKEKRVKKTLFQWQILTDDVLSAPSTLIATVGDMIKKDQTIVSQFQFELLASVKYYEERITPDTFVALFEAGINNVTDKANYSLNMISLFNNIDPNKNVKQCFLRLKIPGTQLGKYIRNDTLLKSDFNLISDVRVFKQSQGAYSLNQLGYQKRYNLLHESSEGYAKLLSLLNEAIASKDSFFQVEYVNNAMEVLIGHFSLDCVKALDLILDLYFNGLCKNYRFFFDFLKASRFWPKGKEADPSSLDLLNKGGNEIAAKLIGGKIKQSYDLDKELNDTFKLALPMLIKIGFISFGSVIPYIGPDKEDMAKFEEHVSEKIEEEVFQATASALALSAPLPDEDENGNPVVKQPLSEAEIRKEAEQKKRLLKTFESNPTLHFVKAALSVGLYWPSIYFLNKYPYLVHADPEIPQLIFRLFHEMAKPLKSKYSILSRQDVALLKKDQRPAFVRNTTPRESVEFEDYGYRYVEIYKPLRPSHTKSQFIFFYREWSEDIPLIHNTEDLFLRSNELLSFVGPKLGHAMDLLAFLSTSGVRDLEENEADQETYKKKLDQWFLYYKKFILPATTALDKNPITTHEAFKLFYKFPVDWRYNLYGDLMKNISKGNIFVKLYYSKAEKATKDLLKRITTENVRSMMRKLAKITYSNPLPAFLVLIQQLESYDNLIELIVEAAHYFNDYAWDVLPYALLVRLTARRSFIQKDGMNDSLWLQSISTFIAKLAKAYKKFDIAPIIDFSIKSIHSNNTIGLTLLRDMINQMGGIQQTSNLSQHQIKLLNAGDSLVNVVNTVIQDKRDQSAESAKRLLSVMAKSNQVTELAVLLNDTMRNFINSSDESSHYKILSNQIDDITGVLHTYIELISYFLRDDPETFQANVCTLNDLISKYKLDPIWAFELWRRNFCELTDVESIEYFDANFEHMSKSLYVDFWRLRLYDIFYDESLYADELKRFKDANFSLDQQLDVSRRTTRGREGERERNGFLKGKEINNKFIANIPLDQAAHAEHSSSVLEAVRSEISSWFKDPSSPSLDEIASLLQFCVIPRATHSSSDAIFAFKFITIFFDTDVAVLVFKNFFDFEILDTLLLSLTPLEAENFGLFFAELFQHFEELRKKPDAAPEFKKEIFNWSEKTLASLTSNITNNNYISRRNTFTFLKNLINSYPIIEDHGDALVEVISKVSAEESRKDIQLAANAILAHIQARSKHWVHIWEYQECSEEEKKELEAKRAELLETRRLKKIEEQNIARRKADLAAASLRSSRQPSRPVSSAAARIATPPVSETRSQSDLFIPTGPRGVAVASSKSHLDSPPVSKGDLADIEMKDSLEGKETDKPSTKEDELANVDKEQSEDLNDLEMKDSKAENEQSPTNGSNEAKDPETKPESHTKDTTDDSTAAPSSRTTATSSIKSNEEGQTIPLALPSGPRAASASPATFKQGRFKDVLGGIHPEDSSKNSALPNKPSSIRSSKPLPPQSMASSQFGGSLPKGKYGQTNSMDQSSPNVVSGTRSNQAQSSYGQPRGSTGSNDTRGNSFNNGGRDNNFGSSNSHGSQGSHGSERSSYGSQNSSYGGKYSNNSGTNSQSYDNSRQGSFAGGRRNGRGSRVPPPPPSGPPPPTSSANDTSVNQFGKRGRRGSDNGYGEGKRFKR